MCLLCVCVCVCVCVRVRACVRACVMVKYYITSLVCPYHVYATGCWQQWLLQFLRIRKKFGRLRRRDFDRGGSWGGLLLQLLCTGSWKSSIRKNKHVKRKQKEKIKNWYVMFQAQWLILIVVAQDKKHCWAEEKTGGLWRLVVVYNSHSQVS